MLKFLSNLTYRGRNRDPERKTSLLLSLPPSFPSFLPFLKTDLESPFILRERDCWQMVTGLIIPFP
jgi:hypothetical protein